MANTGANGAAATSTGAAAGTETTGAKAESTGQTKAGETSTGSSTDAGKTGASEGAAKTGEAGKTGETAAGGETGSKAGGETPKPKAPEKYSLEVPEANKAIADPALQKRIEEIARASDWTNEDAQAALNEALLIKQQEIDGWIAQTKADPDYGGEKLAETQKLAQRGIDAVLPVGHKWREPFLQVMTGSGFGNHPAAVAFLAELGKKTSEDSGARGSRAGAGGDTDAASKMYDHPTSKAVNDATRR